MGQAFLDIQGNALILPPPRLSLLFLLPQIRGVGSVPAITLGGENREKFRLHGMMRYNVVVQLYNFVRGFR